MNLLFCVFKDNNIIEYNNDDIILLSIKECKSFYNTNYNLLNNLKLIENIKETSLLLLYSNNILYIDNYTIIFYSLFNIIEYNISKILSFIENIYNTIFNIIEDIIEDTIYELIYIRDNILFYINKLLYKSMTGINNLLLKYTNNNKLLEMLYDIKYYYSLIIGILNKNII